jgi:type II secretory ATPase GspE/PulE/Tfp pilus assembly ATPase PilB-like protein
MKVEPFLLSATINVAIAQRLCRKICERCKAPAELPDEVDVRFRKDVEAIPAAYRAHLDISGPKLKVFKGKGCVRCGNSGYVGRVAVAELIVYDQPLRDLVAKGFPMEKVRVELERQDAITIREDGLLKALEGSTTIEEVLRVTEE